MGAGIGKPHRIEQRGDDRGEPAVAAHRIDQVEHEKRVPALQGQEMVEVEIDGDDLGGKAELAERASHGFGGEQRVDLVRTFARRGMHDGDEAAWLERHQARLRSCSLPVRLRPSRASP